MTGPLHVHHLNCAHITRMSLGGRPLACHVLPRMRREVRILGGS